MCTHAWLEQRNREVISLENGEKAIVATPEDYEVAYEVFKATCERSVINLSDSHRKILDATYALREEDNNTPDWLGFSQRLIAERAGVAQSTVSTNKAFLVNSVKFMTETQGSKLNLVDGADPSWWEKGDTLDGFPKPEQVRIWWTDDGSPDPSHEPAHGSANQDDRGTNNDDRGGFDHANSLDKPNSAPNPSVIDDIGGFGTRKANSSENAVSSAVEVEEYDPQRISMIVRECLELCESDPKWVLREVHEDELFTDAIGLSWASPLFDKGYDHDEIFEALKIIFRINSKSPTMASAIEG